MQKKKISKPLRTKLHKDIYKLLTRLAGEKGLKRATYSQNLVEKGLKSGKKPIIPGRYQVYHNQKAKERQEYGIETQTFNLRLSEETYDKLKSFCETGHGRGMSISQALRDVLTYQVLNEAKYSRIEETRNV